MAQGLQRPRPGQEWQRPQYKNPLRYLNPGQLYKSAAELLAKVKPIIPRIDGCKILRQDYTVEVPGVPLSMDIQNRKSPENEAIIKKLRPPVKQEDDTPNRNQQD